MYSYRASLHTYIYVCTFTLLDVYILLIFNIYIRIYCLYKRLPNNIIKTGSNYTYYSTITWYLSVLFYFFYFKLLKCSQTTKIFDGEIKQGCQSFVFVC